MAEAERVATILTEVAALAEEWLTYNPGHGDFLTAGKRLREVLEAADDPAQVSREYGDGHYGCVHSIGYCANREWD